MGKNQTIQSWSELSDYTYLEMCLEGNILKCKHFIYLEKQWNKYIKEVKKTKSQAENVSLLAWTQWANTEEVAQSPERIKHICSIKHRGLGYTLDNLHVAEWHPNLTNTTQIPIARTILPQVFLLLCASYCLDWSGFWLENGSQESQTGLRLIL